MKIIRFLVLSTIIATLIPIHLLGQKVETVSKSYSFYIDSKIPSPTEFIQKYVLDSVQLWQKKGRYETTANYKKRVTEANRQILAEKWSKDAENLFLKTYYGNRMEFILFDYDADNQSFLFKSDVFGDVVVPVPLDKAESFEKQWRIDYDNVEYFVDGEQVKLKKLPFISQNKTYLYDNSQRATFAATQINLQLPELELDLSSDEDYENQQSITTKGVTVGRSDVDINIPVTNYINDKAFVVIIANEEYRREASVSFAVNDGRMFKEYCIKTLGIPQQHIHLIENATLNDLRHEINWITNVMTTQKGNANIIFYYAGHGIPDDASKKAYLLPVDGYAADFETGYALDELYAQLGSAPAKSVTYFIDACFSGSKREEGMLASARAVSVRVKDGTLLGPSVAFTASSGEQTAYPYYEKGHGMFTYFLLKKLQSSSGNATYQELSDYITEQVSQQSVINNAKLQTPSVKTNMELKEEWKNWKLK